jgi:hypothetical protein
MVEPLALVMGSNNAFVHLVRAYQRYRVMVGMKTHTSDRLERLGLYRAQLQTYSEVRVIGIAPLVPSKRDAGRV